MNTAQLREELDTVINRAESGQMTKDKLIEFMKNFADTCPDENATYDDIMQQLYVLQDDLQQIENAEL